MSRLEGKVVVVVGGATGSGPGCARRIALEGADVIVADSTAEATEITAAEVRKDGGRASAEPVDVRDEKSVAGLMNRVVEQHGRIHGLHNDMSSYRYAEHDTHIVEIDTETWDDVLLTGLRGYMLTIKHAVPHMARGGGGAIVNVSSLSAWSGRPMNHAYSVAKGGVLTLTASVVATYGKFGIRANTICGGFIVNDTTGAKFSDEFRASVLTHLPYTRLGTPDDLGRLSAFLLSEDADYISGQLIAVDGGMDTPDGMYSELTKPTR